MLLIIWPSPCTSCSYVIHFSNFKNCWEKKKLSIVGIFLLFDTVYPSSNGNLLLAFKVDCKIYMKYCLFFVIILPQLVNIIIPL